MSKTKFSITSLFFSISLTVLYAAGTLNYKSRTTSIAATDVAVALDDQAWLRGDDLSGEQKQAPPSLLMPTDKSISIFEKRINKWPNDSRNYVMLGRLYLRRAKEIDDFSKYVVAEELFKKAIELGDEKFTAHTYLARAYLALHRFKDAGEVATKAWTANPKNELAYATIGDAALQLGDYKRAAAIYQELVKQSTNAPLLARLGRVEELTGNTAQALQNLESAAKLQTESSGKPSDEAWYLWRLGEFEFSRGDLQKATDHLAAALRAAPNDAHALASLAKVYAAQGKTEQALIHYQTSIELLDAPPTRLAYGELLESNGRYAEANRNFQAAEKAMAEEALDPKAGPAHARERATYFLKRKQNLSEALQIANRELEVRKDIYTYHLLAWALYENGMHEEAAAAIDQAMAPGVKDAQILFHAGMIHACLNNRQRSLEYLKQVVELTPQFDTKLAKHARDVISAAGGRDLSQRS